MYNPIGRRTEFRIRGLSMRVAKRKRYEASFKAKVALEALKERKTASELGGQFGVHPNQVTEWRKQLVLESSSLFERGSSKAVWEAGPPSSELYEPIGRLKVEVEFLKKKAAVLGE